MLMRPPRWRFRVRRWGTGELDGDDETPPAVDPTLDETESILVDYLNLLGKVITAKK